VLLSEIDDTRGLIHIPRNVPDVEIFCRVHDEELAETIHEASIAA